MQKTIKAIALLGVFLLLSSVSFGQIQARWVKGKFTSVLKFEKQFLLKEITAPSETSGYGTLYVKSSDGDLYYKDDEGNEIIISHAAVTDAFTVKVDAGATAGYFGVAIGDGIFRVTENQFTMADGGNYVTLSLADHNTARTALGLAIGTDVVAWDGDLDTYAGITPSADVQSLLACATEAAMRTFLDLESGTDFPVVAHTMASHSDEDTYNISTSGSATIGSLIGPAAALDINTSVVQDVNIWDTIASGNPSINIYGWNTAGSDRESAELTMDDTNDEFLIQVPNSANNEGVTVSLQETNQKFRVRQNSDQIQFYHDGTDAYIHTTDGQIIMSTDEAAANAMLGLTDSDGSNEVYVSAPALTDDWILTLPTAVGATAGGVFYDTGGDGVAGWSSTLISQTGGAEVVGTQVAIGTGAKIDFNDGTDESFIRTAVEPGLANHYLGIGLDETNRILAIGDAGNIGTTDLGLSLQTQPAVYIFNADADQSAKISYSGFTASAGFLYRAAGRMRFQTTLNLATADQGMFEFEAAFDDNELDDTNGHQAWMWFKPRVDQSGTAAFDGIFIDTQEEAFGDGSTGDGNNLFRAASLGTTALQVQIPNSSLTYVHTSTLFDAVANTDSVTICTIPANSIIWSISMELETQFAAVGMTDLDVTIGDGTDADGFVVKAMNLTSDAAGTNYATRGALWNTKQQGGFYYVANAETIVATATGDGDDDLSTTSAGQVRFTVAYMCLDEGV